jgi:hypothetical protein
VSAAHGRSCRTAPCGSQSTTVPSGPLSGLANVVLPNYDKTQNFTLGPGAAPLSSRSGCSINRLARVVAAPLHALRGLRRGGPGDPARRRGGVEHALARVGARARHPLRRALAAGGTGPNVTINGPMQVTQAAWPSPPSPRHRPRHDGRPGPSTLAPRAVEALQTSLAMASPPRAPDSCKACSKTTQACLPSQLALCTTHPTQAKSFVPGGVANVFYANLAIGWGPKSYAFVINTNVRACVSVARHCARGRTSRAPVASPCTRLHDVPAILTVCTVVVPQVLLPVYGSVAQFLIGNPQFSALWDAVQSAPAIQATLANPGFSGTVLAPDNAVS